MTIKELKEKRQKLINEVEKADEARFAEIQKEIEKCDFMIAESRKEEAEQKAAEQKKFEEEMRAAREPNKKVLFDQSKQVIEEEHKKQTEVMEKRAKMLKDGGKITIETKAAVASTQTALSTLASGEINPTFEQVGTLDKLVNEVHLEGTGAEGYKKPFEKTIGEGEITKEGQAPSNSAEPIFDYADIKKTKIVAYAEINEEVEKLPAANYMSAVNSAVISAWRKKVVGQIIKGTGTNDELVGIINAPESIIEKSQRKTIATIDENTLDEIIFTYGGDENVEGDAYLILNKLTLKEFAKVKGADKRRAYDIVVRGNTGTINGIPFVCTSKLAAFGAVEKGNPYILYGKLKGYELTYFTALEVTKSTDYKFKEGIIALKVSGIVGGSPAMWNGFMSIEKEKKETSSN